MGVPALFRWLSKKYPKIVSPVIEEQPQEVNGEKIPLDITGQNPNGEEFDNLYLDMNGIVHPCSHPEDRPPPQDEEEMMLEIFKYTERVFNMVRPRKLLMIAVDGVAPRAKMNQQRSRRFRSAKEAKEKDDDKAELLKMLASQQGGTVDQSTADAMTKKTWDHNAITPGTPFMDILAASLRYWTAYKLNTDPAWAKVKVIISDATVPGEGEHKIMGFIRSQRASPDHDPNTRHVIYGLDADLIMLGLATHEPHFRVLREDVFFQDGNARNCRICGQKGHEAKECRGKPKTKEGDFDEKDNSHPLKPFIWLHVSILREYLAAELQVSSQPFRFDLERAIDDWVFMCFFCGNDFLPHLPSLEIREDGIDTLIAIWRDNLPYMGGYLTKDGHVDLERAQFVLDGLAKQEDAIFRRRRQTEERRDANAKRRKLQEQELNGRRGQRDPSIAAARPQTTSGVMEPNFPLFLPGQMSSNINRDVRSLTHEMAVNRTTNKSAAAALKTQLARETNEQENAASTSDAADDTTLSSPFNVMQDGHQVKGSRKRKAEFLEEDDTKASQGSNTPAAEAHEEEAPNDSVRLWEDGYADRYYEQKFKADPKDRAFRQKVANAYVEGLAWVLLYYSQGCPSWEWFYPYHYAPFAADFSNLANLKIKFETGKVFRPFEQLMGVLPAASKHTIPKVFHDLMTNPESEIIDFYPEDFPIDLNGKKFAWQGVALLPWIDSTRLLDAMAKVYPALPPEEAARNTVGKDVLLVAEANESLYNEITASFYSKRQGPAKLKLNPISSDGLTGTLEMNETFLPHASLIFPFDKGEMPTLDDDRSISVYYEMLASDHIHKSMLLRGVKFPTAVLDVNDIEETKTRAMRSGRNYGGAPLQSHSGSRNRGAISYNNSSHQSSYQGQQYHRGNDTHREGNRVYPNGSHGAASGGQRNSAHPPVWYPPPPGTNVSVPGPPSFYPRSGLYTGQVPPIESQYDNHAIHHRSGNNNEVHNGFTQRWTNPGDRSKANRREHYDRY